MSSVPMSEKNTNTAISTNELSKKILIMSELEKLKSNKKNRLLMIIKVGRCLESVSDSIKIPNEITKARTYFEKGEKSNANKAHPIRKIPESSRVFILKPTKSTCSFLKIRNDSSKNIFIKLRPKFRNKKKFAIG